MTRNKQANCLKTKPQFTQNQRVSFVGGMGTVQWSRPDGRQWICAVEMASSPEPEIARIGSETTISQHETDIRAVVNEPHRARS